MASSGKHCTKCNAVLPPGATRCPSCNTPVPGTPSAPAVSAPHEPVPTDGSAEVSRRIERLEQWAVQASPLHVRLPVLPVWAAEAARGARADVDKWSEVVRGVERLAQSQVLSSLREWERQTKTRLSRLEAYAVDSRLEKDQIEDVLNAARTGEVSRALAAFQQVDRVVSLKERHLNQARDELEHIVALLHDMQGIGLRIKEEPAALAEVLERELRRGRLASLRQQLRQLRTQAFELVRSSLPRYIRAYGEFLLQERAEGVGVDPEVAELARASRAFVEGRIEEAVQRLRRLLQVHGSGVFHPPAPDSPEPT